MTLKLFVFYKILNQYKYTMFIYAFQHISGHYTVVDDCHDTFVMHVFVPWKFAAWNLRVLHVLNKKGT